MNTVRKARPNPTIKAGISHAMIFTPSCPAFHVKAADAKSYAKPMANLVSVPRTVIASPSTAVNLKASLSVGFDDCMFKGFCDKIGIFRWKSNILS